MSRPHRIAAIALTMLVAAACTPSGSTSATAVPQASAATSAGPGPSADASATIKVLDFKLEPSTVTIKGSTIALVVSNAGPTIHNVTVRDAAGNVLFGTRDLRQGEGETVTHTLAPGTYTLFCTLPGHESLGVKGTLTVTAP